MEYPFITHGRIIYDPKRGNMTRRTQWWCVIELDSEELARYYRWHIDRMWWQADHRSVKRKYNRPPHRSHISLIRGEKPRKNQHLWGKYMAGEKVFFRYSPVVRQTSSAVYSDESDQFWFIDTDWSPYVEFRKTFGLSWQYNGTPFRSHMTVARTHE